MKAHTRWALNALAMTSLFGAMACGSDATGPDLPNLEGTWTAMSFELTLVDGSGTLDLITGGGGLRLDITASGEVVTTTQEAGSGEISVDQGRLTVLTATSLELRMRANDDTLVLEYVVSGNRLTLSGRFDVNVTGDGVLRSADLIAVFVGS